MNQATKQQIQLLTKKYVEQFDSQAKAVASLKNVSEATIINIKTGKWDAISDDMWRNVGKQVGWSAVGTWNIVETLDFKTLITFFADAKDYSNVFAITGPAGSGKTFVAEWYGRNVSNVYHIVCAEYYNRKMFLSKLMEKMGRENMGYNVSEMMDAIVETLLKQDRPLIILDEADKLNDQVLYFFITLYNMLKGKCGIIIMATDHLQKRINRGYKLNRKGYAEIFSRIGRRFIALHGSSRTEIKEICEANGIIDPVDVNEIYNDYDGDLRRVEKMVHKKRIMGAGKNAA
jgi:Cdc6-like AAA superfamily ATPase